VNKNERAQLEVGLDAYASGQITEAQTLLDPIGWSWLINPDRQFINLMGTCWSSETAPYAKSLFKLLKVPNYNTVQHADAIRKPLSDFLDCKLPVWANPSDLARMASTTFDLDKESDPDINFKKYYVKLINQYLMMTKIGWLGFLPERFAESKCVGAEIAMEAAISYNMSVWSLIGRGEFRHELSMYRPDPDGTPNQYSLNLQIRGIYRSRLDLLDVIYRPEIKVKTHRTHVMVGTSLNRYRTDYSDSKTLIQGKPHQIHIGSQLVSTSVLSRLLDGFMCFLQETLTKIPASHILDEPEPQHPFCSNHLNYADTLWELLLQNELTVSPNSNK
jgi:hypothetical protein